MQTLITSAREIGRKIMAKDILTDNRAMRAFAGQLGFSLHSNIDDMSALRASKPL